MTNVWYVKNILANCDENLYLPFSHLPRVELHCKLQEKLHRATGPFVKLLFLCCSKLHAHFQSMEVRNSSFAAFIDVFTANTYVMVIMSDSSICEYYLQCLYLFINSVSTQIRAKLLQTSYVSILCQHKFRTKF